MAQLLECAAEFRLEDDRDGDQEGGPDGPQDPVERVEFKRPTDEEQGSKEGDNAADEGERARSLGDPEQPVDDEGNDENIKYCPWRHEPLEELPQVIHSAPVLTRIRRGPGPGGQGPTRGPIEFVVTPGSPEEQQTEFTMTPL